MEAEVGCVSHRRLRIRNTLLLLILATLGGTGSSYRIHDEERPEDTAGPAFFEPYHEGFVGKVTDPTNPRRRRVNEGNQFTETHPRLYEGVHPRQECPAMLLGSDNHWYCSREEAGYCDRRSGTCMCFNGYTGVDCGKCRHTHFKEANSMLCAAKVLCPNDCSGGGHCDYATGKCHCAVHRTGDDCSSNLCLRFDPLCLECNSNRCDRCQQGYFVSPINTCVPCVVYGPRCFDCNDEVCLRCADPLLSSIRRSGRRAIDPPLPFDEYVRELSILLPFGTQSPLAFAEAEVYYLRSDTVNLAASGLRNSAPNWRSDPRYIFKENGTNAYTSGLPRPPNRYDEQHYFNWTAQFNVKRGLHPNGTVPAATLEARALRAEQLRQEAALAQFKESQTALWLSDGSYATANITGGGSNGGLDAAGVAAIQELREHAATVAAFNESNLHLLGVEVHVPWVHSLMVEPPQLVPLREEAVACDHGLDRDDRWTCFKTKVSHGSCGHPGTLSWLSPTYIVREDQPYFRVAVKRSGGGLGRVTFKYTVTHVTTDASDMTPVAQYTSDQILVMEEGVVQVSFIVTINDDLFVETGDEKFLLSLGDPDGGSYVGPQHTAEVIIIDDDEDRTSPTETFASGPAVEAASAAHAAAGRVPDLVVRVAAAAGHPAVVIINARDSHRLPPSDAAAAWKWEGGGVDYPGELLGEHLVPARLG